MWSDLLRTLRRLIANCTVAVVGGTVATLPLSVLAQGRAGSCGDPGSTMLWEVQGAALREQGVSVHLFGSIHVGKPEFYPLPSVIETTFRDADHLVFEIDPRQAADPGTALRMQLRGLLPSGQSLDQVISPATMAELQSVLAQYGVAPMDVINLKPWMITLLLANFQAQAMGFDAAWGLEAYFSGQQPAGSDILQLESVEQQLDMLDSLDAEAFLDYSLHEYDRSAAQLDALMQAWRCGDHAALEQVMFASGPEAALSPQPQLLPQHLYEQLFVERNRVMTDGIEQFITDGTGNYFVVVGAGHLLGDDSVIGMLQQRGYHVVPVRL